MLFSVLGEVETEQDKLETARRLEEQALELRRAAGEKLTTAESRLQLAQLTLEEGKKSEAEEAARKSAEGFRAEKAFDDEGLAYSVLARALLGQQKLPLARDFVRSAKS